MFAMTEFAHYYLEQTCEIDIITEASEEAKHGATTCGSVDGLLMRTRAETYAQHWRASVSLLID